MAVTPKIPLVREVGTKSLEPKAVVRTQAIFSGRTLHRGPVVDRSRLAPANALRGPALVIDPESTTFLPPGYAAHVDGFLNLIIRKEGRR